MNQGASRLAILGAVLGCVPLGLSGQLIENGSFEERLESNASAPAGWNIGGQGYEVTLDSTVALDAGTSLRMTQLGASSFGVATQVLDATRFHGHRITLSGYIRTEDVGSGYAGLWLRVDGPDRETLFLDNMAGRGAAGTSDWQAFTVSTIVGPTATRIFLGALMPGSGTSWYDDLAVEAIALEDLPPASESASAYLDRALDIMETNSVRAEVIDWSSFRSAAQDEARGAISLDDMHAVIQSAIQGLGDNHSIFLDPEAIEALRNRSIDEATGSSGLSGQLIDGRIGHLSMPGFLGGGEDEAEAFAEEIQSIIESLDRGEVCGWVVDLRANGGGNMWPMLAGVGPILGTGTVGYFVTRDGEHTPWAYDGSSARMGDDPIVTVSPSYSTRIADPPVAVLTGPRTGSSGEAIVVAFRARPRTRSFGGSTAGVSTANSDFELSDGAMLILTTAVFADRDRVTYGSEIPPDEPVEGDPMKAAVEWLSMQSTCEPPASVPEPGVR